MIEGWITPKAISANSNNALPQPKNFAFFTLQRKVKEPFSGKSFCKKDPSCCQKLAFDEAFRKDSNKLHLLPKSSNNLKNSEKELYRSFQRACWEDHLIRKEKLVIGALEVWEPPHRTINGRHFENEVDENWVLFEVLEIEGMIGIPTN